MRRLLQLASLALLLASFIPLLELFDRWDPPGLANDTEFAVFAFIVLIALILLVSRLIASGALSLGRTLIRRLPPRPNLSPADADHTLLFAVPPLLATPLRI